jgi:hypothetical protein
MEKEVEEEKMWKKNSQCPRQSLENIAVPAYSNLQRLPICLA